MKEKRFGLRAPPSPTKYPLFTSAVLFSLSSARQELTNRTEWTCWCELVQVRTSVGGASVWHIRCRQSPAKALNISHLQVKTLTLRIACANSQIKIFELGFFERVLNKEYLTCWAQSTGLELKNTFKNFHIFVAVTPKSECMQGVFFISYIIFLCTVYKTVSREQLLTLYRLPGDYFNL